MTKPRNRQLYRHLLCAAACGLGLFVVASAQAAAHVRVLLVVGRGVGSDAQAALGSAIAADAQLVDAREYHRAARAHGMQPTSERALVRLGPKAEADLIVVVRRSGARLVVSYRDGASAEVIDKQRFRAARRGAATKRLHAQLRHSVARMLASLGNRTRTPEPEPELAPAPRDATSPPAPPDADDETVSFGGRTGADEDATEPETAMAQEPVEASAEQTRPLELELSAGVGGAMRASALPTRLGVHELNTGVYPGAALGLVLVGELGGHALLRAAIDYRSSLGLRGVETQGAVEKRTPLRSHGVGFGLAPGYRFGGPHSVRLHLYFGWYFRGLRPVAQLALPAISWHGPVLRPELQIPLSDGAVTLRLAPELVIVAGLETTLADETGIAHSGAGLGAEVSLDVRVAEAVSVRIEYRESHVSLSTSWAQDFTDVQRFGAVRAVLHY